MSIQIDKHVREERKTSLNFSGFEINEGDELIVKVGRNELHVVFKAFNHVLYAFYLVDVESGNEIFIPYKNIKYMIKVRRREEAGELQG